MKPVKRSVAVVVRDPGGAYLAVKRPADPADPLAGLWGLPAVTLEDGEDERAAAARAGRDKLGVELAVGRKIGEQTAERDAYVLRLSDYEATVPEGTPSVPQPGAEVTQYAECRFTADPGLLAEAAARGSVCARVFLADAGLAFLFSPMHILVACPRCSAPCPSVNASASPSPAASTHR